MSDPKQEKEPVTAFDLDAALSDTHTPVAQVSEKQPRTTLWLFLGLIGLAGLALFVIFLLPNYTATIHEKAPVLVERTQVDVEEVFELVGPPAELAIAPTPQEVEPEQVIVEAEVIEAPIDPQAQQEAEALLAELIELEADLQQHAVDKWAPEEFTQGTEQGRLGDENLRKKNYPKALEAYQTAIDIFKTLQSQIEPTLEKALNAGELALTHGDKPVALQQFELAIAIDDQNQRAINGMQRTQTIEELFALLQRGSRLETHNQLAQAKNTYVEATELDPLSPEAKDALGRVEGKLLDLEFNQVIAAAFTALQNRQYADARAGFNAANKLKPNAPQVKDGLQKVATAVRNEKITNLVFEADHFAKNEQWQQAVNSYEKILELNSNHQQAQAGLQDVKTKLELNNKLTTIINASDQLYRKEILLEADKALAEVVALQDPGSIIQSQADELRELVREATTPIPVILESDENTEVIVFKVARLGTFKRREMQLKPGPYTIVGTRPGYRDVRKTLVISADDTGHRLEIRCEQPI